LHKLFDAGYVTVTDDYRFEVSPAIKEEYHNGREYYSLHGRKLLVLPGSANDQPSQAFLRWHNENVYRAG
jgi:putative restriction endonuclease